ncbi:MAG: AraC family transcriptional regulator ligand-binding domain-containing protein, partial [Moraxellaceae bacterium]|nr:AraC family transcriptional regulator ligand-binding domain-containing protein [Moraxellaceae bacterium]
AVAESFGIEAQVLLARAGVVLGPAFDECGLSFREYERVMQAVIDLIGPQGPGLEMGLRMSPTAFGSLGLAVISCPTLGEAIAVLQRFWHRFGMGLDARWNQQDGHSDLTLDALPPIQLAHAPMILEATMAALYRSLLMLVPAVEGQTDIWFDFPRPVHATKVERQLGRVRYGMPVCRMRIPAALLEAVLPMANVLGQQAALKACEQESAQDVMFRHSVSALVSQLLILHERRYPDLEQMAHRLHMTTRTLRRQLAFEGTTYRLLRQRIERRDAMRLLEQPQLQVQHVSEMLGYENPANFTRAFRRWTGYTPQEYRQAIASDAPASAT